MPNPEDAAAALVEYQDTADRLEGLQREETADRRREILWWVTAAAAISLGVFASEEFALVVLYPAHSLWLRAKRRRIREVETGELRERMESLLQGDS